MNNDAAADPAANNSGPKEYVAKDGGRFVSPKLRASYEAYQEIQYGPEWHTRDDRPGHTPVDRERQARTHLHLVRDVKRQLAVDDAGLTLAQVQAVLSGWKSQRDRDEVVRALRNDPDITVTREPRMNRAGRPQEQVVLRLPPDQKTAAR